MNVEILTQQIHKAIQRGDDPTTFSALFRKAESYLETAKKIDTSELSEKQFDKVMDGVSEAILILNQDQMACTKTRRKGMVKIYKVDNNGEIIVSTSETDLDQFTTQFGIALLDLIEKQKDDTGFAMQGALTSAFQLAFKISGYKAEKVNEQRVLTCGFGVPSEDDLLVSAGA